MGKTDVATTVFKHHIEWAKSGGKVEGPGECRERVSSLCRITGSLEEDAQE